MSIWKDNIASRPAPTPAPEPKEPARFDAPSRAGLAPVPAAAPGAHADVAPPHKESTIAADITIEGKIEGGGSIRIAGRFKGDVNLQGDLTIEAGAKLTGAVRAHKVTIAGELEGNVEQASFVDLLQTAVVIGNLKAGSLTVAAGARLRGQAEFGWEEGKSPKAAQPAGVHDAGAGIGS
jgi:cytoskeletal protein CcmA (bactofilin family)